MKSKTGERRGKTNVEQVEKRVPQDNNPNKKVSLSSSSLEMIYNVD
jgi:hypothetical protein